MAEKVTATPEALQLLAEIVADHGPVLFHQSGGCCDGSSPMCYPRGEFLIGDRDVKLGEIGDQPFYISESQYEAWKHTDLIIDVVTGRDLRPVRADARSAFQPLLSADRALRLGRVPRLEAQRTDLLRPR